MSFRRHSTTTASVLRTYFIVSMQLLLACSLPTKAFANGQPTLAQVSLELSEKTTLPLASSIRFDVQSINPQVLAETLRQWRGIVVEGVGEDAVSVQLSSRLQYTGGVKSEYTKSSFVVDYDELSTAEFINRFASTLKPGWGTDEIQVFVSEFITEPSYIHSFNVASVVASNKSGDCTEYAVLSAALSRALQLPARVVLGTVIVEDANGVSAFGHAWTEVWHKEAWQLVDAALHQAPYKQLFYLPISTLSSEGPGFAFGLLKPMSMLPSQILQVRSVETPH